MLADPERFHCRPECDAVSPSGQGASHSTNQSWAIHTMRARDLEISVGSWLNSEQSADIEVTLISPHIPANRGQRIDCQQHASCADNIWYNATSPIFIRNPVTCQRIRDTLGAYIAIAGDCRSSLSYSPTDDTRCWC